VLANIGKGRIPETTVECIRFLRTVISPSTVISVEVEKPGRVGLIDMALLADFVFFSRSWAMVCLSLVN
jgi:ketohexokinase